MRRHLVFAFPAVLACAIIAVPAALGGGYDPSWWGWFAFVPLVIAAVALASRRAGLTRAELQLVGGLAVFVGWTALSSLWSQSVPRTISEVERDIVYVAAALALVVVRRSPAALVAGVVAATAGIAAEALASRLWSGASGRLDGPLIYWNALGILCAAGLLLALGVASARGRDAARAAAAVAVVVLAAALYLTYSRGAIAALAAGFALLLALDARRLRLACVGLSIAPFGVSAAVLAAHGPRAAAAIAIPFLAAAAGAAAVASGRLQARLEDTALRRRMLIGTVSLLGILVAVAVVRAGPGALAARLTGSAAGAAERSAASQTRLLTLSDQGRVEYWRVAWNEFASAPLRGTGAGTYELAWHAHRNTFYDARDAHSLYLETLAETGPIGLALLILALAAPFVRTRVTRRHPLGPPLLAAYGAILLHAAIDWDWEMPAVFAAALACGVTVLGVRDVPRRPLGRGAGRVGAAVVTVLAAAAIGVQLENGSQSRAYAALSEKRFVAAERDARRARTLAPWASEPLRVLGEAALAQQRLSLARARFRQALRKDPNDWHLWYDLAAASSGHPQATALAEALRLNPLEPTLLAFADRLRAAARARTIGP